jgi:hypothetical protein
VDTKRHDIINKTIAHIRIASIWPGDGWYVLLIITPDQNIVSPNYKGFPSVARDSPNNFTKRTFQAIGTLKRSKSN